MPLAEPMDESPTLTAAGPGQARLGSGVLHQNGGTAQGPARIPPPPGLSEADVKLLLGKAQGLPDGDSSQPYLADLCALFVLISRIVSIYIHYIQSKQCQIAV